jgi:hypothetical protein
LAGGTRNIVYLWETATGQERGRFAGHRGEVGVLTFAPEGRRLTSGAADGTLLVWDVTGRLRGGRLGPAEFTAGELEGAWTDLGAADSARAYRAIWGLAAAPRQALPLLKDVLRPVQIDEARLGRLIGQLDDDDFATRERASDELAKLGDAAEPALRQAAARAASAEMLQRVRQLLEKLDAPNPSAERVRQSRALEVLEQMCTPEARQLLEALAKGAPAARQTADAKGALERQAKPASIPEKK